jgi:hypothetical protein
VTLSDDCSPFPWIKVKGFLKNCPVSWKCSFVMEDASNVESTNVGFFQWENVDGACWNWNWINLTIRIKNGKGRPVF